MANSDYYYLENYQLVNINKKTVCSKFNYIFHTSKAIMRFKTTRLKKYIGHPMS